MSHIVTEPCVKCRYTDCVTVCPVDCFHEDNEMLVIDPEVCIDCGQCLPECPINAIVATVDESPEWGKVNAELTPSFKNNPKVTERSKSDPPRKPTNKLVQ